MAPASGAGDPESTAEAAVERFLALRGNQLTQYRAIRRFEGHNTRFRVSGSLDALTELSDGRFSYTILRESGSEYVRNKVLRPMLENEQELFASRDPEHYAFSIENYDFSSDGERVLTEDELTTWHAEEPVLVKLRVKPRRRDVGLIDGVLFIVPDSADLMRVEGRLAKNPSFWTSRVELIRQYDRIAGIQVPVRLDTTAQLKLAGQSTLSVVYEYEMVNGVTVPSP